MEAQESIQAVQEALRGVVFALAMEMHADMGRLASAIAAFAEHQNVSPTARAMLFDLARGLAMVGGAGQRKQ